MNRSILLGTALVITLGASAQCTPNQLYADSVYGVWPDTTENFAGGMVNLFYNDTLNILVPQDAGLVNPDFEGYQIDSVALDQVTNLPPGLSVVCSSQTGAPCTFLPNQVGCGTIEGTPTTAGTYEMTVDVIAYSLFGSFVIPVPQSFAGYRIIIAEDNTGIAASGILQLSDVRTIPNPVSEQATIAFGLNRAISTRVRVFNLVGEKLWDRTLMGRQGQNTIPFDAGELENGVYLYTVEAGARTFTGRMVVSR